MALPMRLLPWRKKPPAANRRYVVSIRQAGLGDRLICLCAAWIFARDTGRTLVAEWQGAQYLADEKNLFPACFKVGNKLAGVPFIAVDGGFAELPRPRHPSLWEDETFSRQPWLLPDIEFPRDDALDLIRSRDIDIPTVVFDACINDGVVSLRDARSFMAALQPIDRIGGAVDAFWSEHLKSGPVIGLHLRHGNGGDIMGHAPYWTSFGAAIDRCCRAVAMARARIGENAKVFLCSDSIEAEDEILKRIPGTVVRTKRFRPVNAGELHGSEDAQSGLDDALVEMLLLARCQVLIRYPPGSFFSFPGAVLKPSTMRRPATVYDLQTPSDLADRLSPAVLF